MLLATTLVAMFACTKDDNNKPDTETPDNTPISYAFTGPKISKIYMEGTYTRRYTDNYRPDETSSTPRHLYLEFLWDGDKLSELRYYDNDGNVSQDTRFFYDDDKPVRVDNYRGDTLTSYVLYSYTDGRITSFSNYIGDQLKLNQKYELSYDSGNRVTRMVVRGYLYDKSADASEQALMCVFRDRNLAKTLAAHGKAKSTEEYTTINTLEYTGNNVSRIVWASEDGEGECVETLSYDTHANPFHGVWCMLNSSQYLVFNENNCVSMNATESYNENGVRVVNTVGTITGSYTYDSSGRVLSENAVYTAGPYHECEILTEEPYVVEYEYTEISNTTQYFEYAE